MTEGSDTKDNPWLLTTPPGTSSYTMFRDEAADPPALVGQVGSTTLRYRLQAIEDLHAWLLQEGDWILLGVADENKDAEPGPSKPGDGLRIIPWEAGTGCAKGTAAASPCTCHHCWSGSGWLR